MPINPQAVGAESEAIKATWSPHDCMLYAVGVGAGVNDLAFTTEKNQQVLPTFAVIPGMHAMTAIAGIGPFDLRALVHAEQEVRLYADLPVQQEVEVTGVVSSITDKGSGALVEITGRVTSLDGTPLADSISSLFIRGEGGFGDGVSAKPHRSSPPEREPDYVIEMTTGREQALIYRLSGDTNPLHSDPEFASKAGFERPILHGLCTYGFTGRAILDAVCGGDVSKFGSMYARFSRPVMPGDALRVSIWETGSGTYAFRTDTSQTVIDNGQFVLRDRMIADSATLTGGL